MTENFIIIDKKRNQQQGIFLSTLAVIGWISFFCICIAATILTTYFLTYDVYKIEVHPKKDIHLPSHILPAPRAEIDYRLPTNLVPYQYLIKLHPFLEEKVYNFTTNGYVEVSFTCVDHTNLIVLHKRDITVDESSVKILDATTGIETSHFVTHFEFDPVTEFYTTHLNGNLEIGVNYTVVMNYTAYLNPNLEGFYRSSYEDADGNEVYLGATQFEATEARMSFPCFDEPALKAKFEVHMLRNGTNLRTISNMPRKDTYEASAPWGGWYWDIFENSVTMSTYLVAYVVSDFANSSSNANDHVLFRVFAREAALYQADYALSIGPDVLTFFESYFSIPFPLPKQDMIALPDFDAGAMENWGLITYRETALLYDPVLGSASNKQRVGVVVAHELAHQWFGDLVSPEWWTYLWLNEGFASYMEYIGLDDVQPDFKMLDQFVLDTYQYAFSVDALESSHPITVEVTNPAEVWEIFDSISYNKGASIIRMMEYFLTTATFRAGLTNYLNKYQYDTATQDDLWNSMTEQAHADGTLATGVTVKEIMDTWTLQMGYPVISVVRSEAGTLAYLTQDRFLLLGNSNSSDSATYSWWVPITYATKDVPDFSGTYPADWIQPTEKTIVINTGASNTEWIIVNTQLGGYYRVNYEESNWKMIQQQLLDNLAVISIINRAQVIDDALDLARGGLLSYDLALNITTYLDMEQEYVPWSAALDNLSYLEEMFSRIPSYIAMKNYLLSILTPLYVSTGFDDDMVNDNHMVQLTRSMVLSWTCHLEYLPCVSNSVALYAQWMQNPNNLTIISPNLKSTVYCTAIAEGNETEWEFAYQQYLSSNLGSEKSYLLRAMGCSKSIPILQGYLDIGFTEEFGIRKQDSYMVFNSVAGNDIGNSIAWEYLDTNWDALAAYYGESGTCADYAYSASTEYNTQADYDKVSILYAAHIDELNGATQSFDQALENVQNNINWMTHYRITIDQWLIDNGYGSVIFSKNDNDHKRFPSRLH